jgi:transposase
MSHRGKEFTPEMRQLVVQLKQYFDAEKAAGSVVLTKNSTSRTAKALDIGKATVKRIMAEYNKNDQKIVIKPQAPRGKPAYQVATNLQPIIRQYVRSENLKGLHVSIQKLQTYLFENHQAQIATATLWRALQRWGFVYGTDKRRSALKERDEVILARRKYLRAKRANRNPDGTLKRPEIYLDETYINRNHSNQFIWYLEEDGAWVNKPSGKGPRWIIVHAITKDGWVNGAQLVFQAKKRTGDYHGQMNWENFSKWFTEQLMPNIPPKSIIIMDNARYHNVFVNETPTSGSSKEELRKWLSEHNYSWTEDMLKAELLALCKKFSPPPKFKIDQLAESHGHTILRTPQYHPELQPIETCWAIVKNYMADNCDFTMDNFRYHLPIAFTKVTAQSCKKIISEVVEQEEKFWEEDNKLDEMNNLTVEDSEELEERFSTEWDF